MDGWSALIGILGAVTAGGSVVALFLKSRGENKTSAVNAKTTLDSRIDKRVDEQLQKAWDRMDEQDKKIGNLEDREIRRTGAITRILRSIAMQWPVDTHGPDLDPTDIREIEETIPPSWIRNKPTA